MTGPLRNTLLWMVAMQQYVVDLTLTIAAIERRLAAQKEQRG